MYPHFGDARIVDLISLGAKVLLIFPAILKRKRIQPLLVIYHTLLLKEGIRKVLENDLPSLKDGITPEGTTLH